MTTRLVLVLDLGAAGDEPGEVRAYGEQLVESIRDRHRAGLDSVIEWRADQLADVRIESGDPS
jgi:hypothetical protein